MGYFKTIDTLRQEILLSTSTLGVSRCCGHRDAGGFVVRLMSLNHEVAAGYGKTEQEAYIDLQQKLAREKYNAF